MNYIEFINRFWQLRRSRKITNVQADLYFFLLQESNQRNWENPFYCSNGLVCSGIGVTEKTLIDARNVLKQVGLIDFKNGVTKQKAPQYFLNDYWNKVSNPVSNGVSNPVSNGVSIDGGNEASIEANIISKQNKTKRNNSSSGSDEPAHWKKIVECWFDFYKANFRDENGQPITPLFNSTQGAHLKKILAALQKLAKAKNHDWDEDYAVKIFAYFLKKAWNHDEWMRQNFELQNLLSKFNSITANGKQNGNSASGSTKPGTSEARIDGVKQIDLARFIQPHNS